MTFCVFANSEQSWKEHELFLKYQEITNWRLDRLEKLNGNLYSVNAPFVLFVSKLSEFLIEFLHFQGLSPPEELIKASLTGTFDAAISSKSQTNSESQLRDTDRTLQQGSSSYGSSVLSVKSDNSSITFGN